jgi:hypothetical protein
MSAERTQDPPGRASLARAEAVLGLARVEVHRLRALGPGLGARLIAVRALTRVARGLEEESAALLEGVARDMAAALADDPPGPGLEPGSLDGVIAGLDRAHRDLPAEDLAGYLGDVRVLVTRLEEYIDEVASRPKGCAIPAA